MPEVPGDLPRYETLFRLAAGGMATVHLGTARGALGFRQIVAIKKPHKHLLDPAFRKAFVTEARLASLLHHANVVDVRDIEVNEDEVSLIMAYVEGATFGELLQIGATGGPKVSPDIAVRVVLDACAGLHAAHELADERGRPLQLVHRDISPQNLLVGVDGVTRVADFGIAKFKSSGVVATSQGTLKGKVAYMAPEYLRGEKIDRRFDVFALGIVLWEGITGRRLFRAEFDTDTMDRVLHHDAPPVATFSPEVGSALDAVLQGALAKSPSDRFENAAAMAAALEASARSAGMLPGHREVADLVQSAVGAKLEERRAIIRERLANEPSVASVSFEQVDVDDLVSTRKAKPLPNSSLDSASAIIVAPRTTVPDPAPRGLSPSAQEPRMPPPAPVLTAPVVLAGMQPGPAGHGGGIPPTPPGHGGGIPPTPPGHGGGGVGGPALPQTTRPLVAEPLPAAVAAGVAARKARGGRVIPATLRSEAPFVPGSGGSSPRAGQSGAPRTPVPPTPLTPGGYPPDPQVTPGGSTMPLVVGSREDGAGGSREPAPGVADITAGARGKRKKRFRAWPYIVAIVVGAAVGIVVAIGAGKRMPGVPASPANPASARGH